MSKSNQIQLKWIQLVKPLLSSGQYLNSWWMDHCVVIHDLQWMNLYPLTVLSAPPSGQICHFSNFS